jgi:hypothetical protein
MNLIGVLHSDWTKPKKLVSPQAEVPHSENGIQLQVRNA